MSQPTPHDDLNSGRWSLSPQASSTTRLAFVACAVLATVGVLIIVALQARRAEQTLDESASQTLRDYTGYAGRIMGGEVLRRFSEQRSAILAPVSGSAYRVVTEPTLDDIAARGSASFASVNARPDPGLGYFRLDPRTGALAGTGSMIGPLAQRVADTIRVAVASRPVVTEPEVLVVMHEGTQYSVAFARLLDREGRVASVYGFTYTRALLVTAVADRVFEETPLLPTSFAGSRWNYDTTRVRTGEIANASLLGMWITDRGGYVLWQSKGAAAAANSPFRQKVVLRTVYGGLIVEAALLPAGEPSLVPGIVRRAQRWSLGALLAISAMLAAVSLVALGGERLGARSRRVDAMKQLALGLRHELNNALASVMLDAELLNEETTDPAHRERLESMVDQTDRMRNVLRRLEKTDRLDVVVPYLNEEFMVDLSETSRRA